ncbi:LPS export ABC transporter periplasmic protein LptC [Bizionia argentinensis JUB59]|uniref:LPS export ABC transporter periplasmic protein LptC n=1 Tax=Bizionia argentinensis JUB59 TaxID=1046627 RepID=G2EDX1_9FLAO|nr:LPS export ABC transporter periplasmic protein LptC [Bizionia argentinensis]EGV43364.2 LPS export ABC transporter periplasmic protein LptC [Bizionia argentinensis JUB59]
MFNITNHIKKTIVIAFALTVVFSCKNNFDDVKKIGISENAPIGVAENLNLKYTDSGRVTANLRSPKMLDFSNRDFPFSEFPDHVELDLFDDANQKSTITADYAIVYDKTGLIDMQGNVVLASPENDTLFAEQLYYDQNREWLFTNKPVMFKSKGNILRGNMFDSNVKFTQVAIAESKEGVIILEE